tara:strand:- start:2123 stop:2302 length:180 start_codon:yes stop_codon:yes gene_type:complete
MKYIIDNILVGGIDGNDYPDFCDAFIAGADIDGVAATEEQLEELNEDSNFVHECVWGSL